MSDDNITHHEKLISVTTTMQNKMAITQLNTMLHAGNKLEYQPHSEAPGDDSARIATFKLFYTQAHNDKRSLIA